MRSHFLYIIAKQDGDGVSAPIKVGISSNPQSRLDALQTGSSFKLAIAEAIELPCRELAQCLERGFHATQSDRRLQGEWFDIPPLEASHIIGLHIAVLSQVASA